MPRPRASMPAGPAWPMPAPGRQHGRQQAASRPPAPGRHQAAGTRPRASRCNWRRATAASARQLRVLALAMAWAAVPNTAAPSLSVGPGPFGCQHLPQSAMPFCDAAQPTAVRVRDLVGRLTLAEKVGQLSHGGAFKNGPAPAIARLGVAAWQWGTECLSGDVWAGPATSFPQSLTLASSFDLDLALRVANATGAEVRAKNNDVVSRNIHAYHTGLSCWSPVLNIARHPLWGRQQETYGECPFVNGVMGAAFVRGLQGNNSSKYLQANAGCVRKEDS